MDSKSVFASLTNWGSIIALALGLLPLCGVHLTDTQTGDVAQGITALVAFILALYGRIRAGATPLKLFGVLLMTVQHATDLLNTMPSAPASASPAEVEPVPASSPAPVQAPDAPAAPSQPSAASGATSAATTPEAANA